VKHGVRHVIEGAPGLAEEDDVDPCTTRNVTQSMHRFERAVGIDVAQDERRPLDCDAPVQHAERHVNEVVATRA
jgi:hypothetical protein